MYPPPRIVSSHCTPDHSHFGAVWRVCYRQLSAADSANTRGGPLPLAVAVGSSGRQESGTLTAPLTGWLVIRRNPSRTEARFTHVPMLSTRRANCHVRGVSFHRNSSSSVLIRSEERRVGKECRSRWSPYH